ncbi:MAG TPA: 1,3-beta-glucanase, partial [Mycobacterium sp.]|nr:1,3-beta-glucanase [Mycobacterium sp.]
MMLMTGIGVLAAAIPVPVAGAEPSRPAAPAPA